MLSSALPRISCASLAIPSLPTFKVLGDGLRKERVAKQAHVILDLKTPRGADGFCFLGKTADAGKVFELMNA
ncbi:hypothetical protein LguiB_031705 [Lonicera macranthoides]